MTSLMLHLSILDSIFNKNMVQYMISLYGRLYEYIFIDSNLKDFSFIMIVFEGIFGNSWI